MSLVSIVLPFVTTLVGSGIAALVALWIQRRAFRARALELEQQTADARSERLAAAEARREDRRIAAEVFEAEQEATKLAQVLDWRRGLVAKAFEVIDASVQLDGTPGTWSREPFLRAQVDSLQMLFRVDPAGGGQSVGEWFKRSMDVLARSGNSYYPGASATIRFELTEWAQDRKTSCEFDAL